MESVSAHRRYGPDGAAARREPTISGAGVSCRVEGRGGNVLFPKRRHRRYRALPGDGPNR